MSENSYNYTKRKGIQPISWEDFHGICKALAKGVSRFNPEIVLAIGRGGYYPGTLLAHMLQVELYPVRVSRRIRDIVKYKTPQWFVEPSPHVENHLVLIVDDVCSSGETISIVKEKVLTMGAKRVKSAVLYAHTGGVSVPDYIGLVTDALLLNPWDREVLRDGSFQIHPEYKEAYVQQGIETDPTLLIDATTVELAKG